MNRSSTNDRPSARPRCAIRSVAAVAALALLPIVAAATPIAGVKTFVNGEIANADEVMANFAAVETHLSGVSLPLMLDAAAQAAPLLGQLCPTGQHLLAIQPTPVPTIVCAPMY